MDLTNSFLKNNNKKGETIMKKSAKIITATLAAITVIFAAMAISVSADTETKPDIISQNVAYTGDFALMYAVDPATVTAPVTLNIYEAEPTETSTAKYTFTQTATTPAATSGLDIDAYIFIANGTAAKDMTKVYYAQVVDADGDKSELKRYSVTEYLYERLATSDITEKQEALYQAVITFGDKAIDLLATGNPLVSDYKYVTIDGGTLDGTYDAGIYLKNDTVNPQAEGVTSWTATDGTKVANGESYTVGDSHVSFAETVETDEPTVDTITIDRTKTGTNTFDTSSIGSFPTALGWDSGMKGTDGGVRSDTVYSTSSQVLVIDPITKNNAAKLYSHVNPPVAEADDIAYEFSADIKLVPDEGVTDFTQRIWLYATGNKAVFTLYVRSYNGGWEFWNSENGEEKVFVENTGYNYNHVCFRFVGEAGSLVAKLYINGEHAYDFTTEVAAQADTFGFKDMHHARFVATDLNNKIYIDNLYVGFVKEE